MEPINETPPIIMNQADIAVILKNIGPNNFLGKGAAGTVYRFDYYNIPAVIKVPNDETKKLSLRNEIVNYSYICKVFNDCLCKNNIVQMLGYDSENALIMLEYFDGSDLTSYTGYPMTDITHYTHRLLPRTSSSLGSADFSTLGKYLGSSNFEDITFILFNKIYTGILCLHHVGVLHLDFELKNILIRSDGKIGIADFGLSRIISAQHLAYGYSALFSSFTRDIDSIGPMMGNFLDSTNPQPYQYRLDNQAVDNMLILNNLKDPVVKDTFLVLTTFKDLVTFVSIISYLNSHVDLQTGREFIEDSAAEANDILDEEVTEEDEKEFLYITDDDINTVINTMFNKITPESGLSKLVLYFRLIFDQILRLNGADPLSTNESVHDHIKRMFGSNYNLIMTSAANLLRYGFLLKHFNLFNKVYQ